ncbi:MAG: hypothetical protein ACKVOG_00065 [Rhodoglobus sp.]
MTAPGYELDATWLSATLVLALWLVALSVQLADLGTARFDIRRLNRGTRTLVRLHPVTWVVPLAAGALVALGFGVDYGQRLLFEEGQPVMALTVGLIIVVGLVAGWVVVTSAATSPAADSYRAIRDELVELRGSRVQQEWLDGLRERLSAIDEATARALAPPVVSWRTATGWVFRRPQRILPVVAAVLLLVLASIAAVGSPGHDWVVLGTVGAVLVSSGLAVLGARASLVLLSAVRETQLQYRRDADQLLIEAEKTSRKPVAGLGERVNRALQILREQQG